MIFSLCVVGGEAGTFADFGVRGGYFIVCGFFALVAIVAAFESVHGAEPFVADDLIVV